MSDELREASGRGYGLSPALATVAAAALAVVSGIGGAFIQSLTTRDVEAGKSLTALNVEKTKAEGDLALERQKQAAAADLARQEFETKLILKAIETPDREEATRNLQFFLKAGFIQDKGGKIAALNAEQYPSITPPANVIASPPVRRPSGQPPTAQDQVSPRINEILPSFEGYYVAGVAGTNGGRLAAAWIVNEIVRVALGKPLSGEALDNDLSINATYDALRSRHIERTTEQLNAGMIIITPSIDGNAGHMGIVGERLADGNFTIYSNSSARAVFTHSFTLKTWKAFYEDRKGLRTYFFELNYKEFNNAVAGAPP